MNDGTDFSSIDTSTIDTSSIDATQYDPTSIDNPTILSSEFDTASASYEAAPAPDTSTTTAPVSAPVSVATSTDNSLLNSLTALGITGIVGASKVLSTRAGVPQYNAAGQIINPATGLPITSTVSRPGKIAGMSLTTLLILGFGIVLLTRK